MMSADSAAASAPKRMVRVVVLAAFRTATLLALWLLLVDSTDEQNLFTGIGVALLGAMLGGLLQHLRPVRLAPRPVMVRFLHRPLVLLFSDTFRVMRVLLVSLPKRSSEYGRLRVARYTACEEDPDGAARRVLTEWGASLGSNRYVVGIDAGSGVLLVHELTPASGPLDPLELG